MRDDDMTMRLAGLTHIEPMHDLCDYLLEQDLDGETREHVEQVQERVGDLEDMLDEIEEQAMSVTIEEASAQLDELAAFFDVHAMKIAQRARTARRVLDQDTYFVRLRHEQSEGADARKIAQVEAKAGHRCKACRRGRMVLRTRESDGEYFWSCERYPHCRGVFNLSRDERARLE